MNFIRRIQLDLLAQTSILKIDIMGSKDCL